MMSQGLLTPHFGSATVFWTLVIELHLYLAYPLLFHLSRKRGTDYVLVLMLLVSLISNTTMRVFHVAERRRFWHPSGPGELMRPPVFLKYWSSWSIGFYSAEIVAGLGRFAKAFVWPKALSALLVAIPLSTLSMVDFAETPFALFFSWLQLCCSQWQGLSMNVLVRLIALVGTMSYSLYCTHVPALRLCRTFLNSSEPSESTLPTLAGVFVTLLVSTAVYWFIDHKSMGWSRGVREIGISDNA